LGVVNFADLERGKKAVSGFLMNMYVLLKVLAVLLFIVGVFFFHPVFMYSTVEYISIRVTDKERVVLNKSSKYLVYADSEVFENVDDIWFFKFDSSDVQRKLTAGEHRVKVAGWRVPQLSWYRNILEVD
jgi:hypothetical protein